MASDCDQGFEAKATIVLGVEDSLQVEDPIPANIAFNPATAPECSACYVQMLRADSWQSSGGSGRRPAVTNPFSRSLLLSECIRLTHLLH